METQAKVKLFFLANSLAENGLDKVEKTYDVDLGRKAPEPTKEQDYYAQFESVFRKEAKEMSKHYEVFYCLEKSIRSLVVQLMKEKYGEGWWDSRLKEELRKNVEFNIKKEVESGFTQRSEDKIDYTTFGELTTIVQGNWEAFADL